MIPTAVTLALQLPHGVDQALGIRSLGQLVEPGPDPDSAERLVQEILEEFQ